MSRCTCSYCLTFFLISRVGRRKILPNLASAISLVCLTVSLCVCVCRVPGIIEIFLWKEKKKKNNNPTTVDFTKSAFRDQRVGEAAPAPPAERLSSDKLPNRNQQQLIIILRLHVTRGAGRALTTCPCCPSTDLLLPLLLLCDEPRVAPPPLTHAPPAAVMEMEAGLAGWRDWDRNREWYLEIIAWFFFFTL